MITKRQLLRGNIIGVVTAQGQVDSQFTGGEIKTHDIWPRCRCRWRWNHDKSIHTFLSEGRPTAEETEAIRNHLTRKYGLKWWENGHHDIDDLLGRKPGVPAWKKVEQPIKKLPDVRFRSGNSADSNRVFLWKNHDESPFLRPVSGWKVVGWGKAPWPGSSNGFAVMLERVMPYDTWDNNSMPEGTRIWQHLRENDFKRFVADSKM